VHAVATRAWWGPAGVVVVVAVVRTRARVVVPGSAWKVWPGGGRWWGRWAEVGGECRIERVKRGEGLTGGMLHAGNDKVQQVQGAHSVVSPTLGNYVNVKANRKAVAEEEEVWRTCRGLVCCEEYPEQEWRRAACKVFFGSGSSVSGRRSRQAVVRVACRA